MKFELAPKWQQALLCAALLTLCAGAPAATEESDEDMGMSFEEKLQACAACHGENGDKPLLPEYPKLAGQYSDYLATALRAYRDGRRQNPVMGSQVEILGLTDSDIDRMAEHFASKPGLTSIER